MESVAVEYREIPYAPAYRVGRDGSVWSRLIVCNVRGRLGPWRQLSLVVHDSGRGIYNRVALRHEGRSILKYVHHLVLEMFVGPCPEGLEACHRDGNGLNNRLENLRWDTHQANVEDSMALGRVPKGERHHAASLSETDVLELVRISREIPGATHAELGMLFGVTKGVVGPILRGLNWSWLTGIEPSKGSLGRPHGRRRLRDIS